MKPRLLPLTFRIEFLLDEKKYHQGRISDMRHCHVGAIWILYIFLAQRSTLYCSATLHNSIPLESLFMALCIPHVDI